MTTKFDIAASMNGIMKSPDYQAVFSKPQPQFNKTAAKKDDKKDGDKLKDCVAECKKIMKEIGCKGSVKASDDKCVITCDDKGAIKKCKAVCKKHGVPCEVKEPKSKKASQYHACVMGLAKISEALDKMGLAKESAHAIIALDGLVKAAQSTGEITYGDGTVVPIQGGSITGTVQLHPQDPDAGTGMITTPDAWLTSTDPNDPLNPWIMSGGAPDQATIQAILAARQAYRAAGGDVAGADDGSADCGMADCGSEDENDAYTAQDFGRDLASGVQAAPGVIADIAAIPGKPVEWALDFLGDVGQGIGQGFSGEGPKSEGVQFVPEDSGDAPLEEQFPELKGEMVSPEDWSEEDIEGLFEFEEDSEEGELTPKKKDDDEEDFDPDDSELMALVESLGDDDEEEGPMTMRGLAPPGRGNVGPQGRVARKKLTSLQKLALELKKTKGFLA